MKIPVHSSYSPCMSVEKKKRKRRGWHCSFQNFFIYNSLLNLTSKQAKINRNQKSTYHPKVHYILLIIEPVLVIVDDMNMDHSFVKFNIKLIQMTRDILSQ